MCLADAHLFFVFSLSFVISWKYIYARHAAAATAAAAPSNMLTGINLLVLFSFFFPFRSIIKSDFLFQFNSLARFSLNISISCMCVYRSITKSKSFGLLFQFAKQNSMIFLSFSFCTLNSLVTCIKTCAVAYLDSAMRCGQQKELIY